MTGLTSANLAPSDRDELSTLHEASQEISRKLQLDEILKLVLSKAHEVTGADLVQVYLADRKGALKESRFVTNLTRRDKSGLPASSLAPPELFGLVEQAALAQEIGAYADSSLLQGWSETSLRSILLIPLVSRKQLMGMLAIGSQKRGAFSASQERWLSIFCDQAAIAMENAYLFQNLSSAYIDLAQSREQILHSRNTLQVLFDSITDGLCILNPDLTISSANQVEAERQGTRPEELAGKSYLSLPWTTTAPGLLQCIREALQTGRETTWIAPENETGPYLKDREFRIYPIRNRLGHIEQVVVFAQDVSERRRWQASLFRSANLAAVGQLAGSVAHQINNPLTVVMANSQLLLEETEPATESHELLRAVFKASERIQSIVQNLLEFSNQETYTFVEADLVDTIEGALDLVLRSLKKARIDLIRDYQIRPRLSISVSHLKLVWMNLLLNARDAVADHAAQPQVKISTRAVSEDEVAVTITDNGVGISEKDVELIFRPFYTTKPTALGLGLYSAQAIVERHQGRIVVHSEADTATTFEVVLPLNPPAR